MKITNLIYETLDKENKEWVPKAHYPSSASFKYSDGTLLGPDLLSQYLKWTGVKPSNPPDAASLLKMRLGDGAHKELAKILQVSGIKVISEVGAKNTIQGLKNQVSYRVDHLLETPEGLVVLEVKSSMQQQMFSPGWGIKFTGPKPDHLLQVICYLNLVPGVRKAILLYIDRGSGGMLQFNIEKVIDGTTDDRYSCEGKLIKELSWYGILLRWKTLEHCLEHKTPPEPEYKAWLNESGEVMEVKTIKGVRYKTDWRVVYDPYRDLIWKNKDNYKFTFNYEFENKGK